MSRSFEREYIRPIDGVKRSAVVKLVEKNEKVEWWKEDKEDEDDSRLGSPPIV